MSRHRADWAACTPRIAHLASQGRTDAEIAELFGVTPAVILDVRRRYGIPAGWRQKTVPEAVTPAVQMVETYVVDGVTYCPARWAEGAE